MREFLKSLKYERLTHKKNKEWEIDGVADAATTRTKTRSATNNAKRTDHRDARR